MKKYNINVIEHDIDRALNQDYSAEDLYDLCREKSYNNTSDFCERLKTFETKEEAEAAFDTLKPSTKFLGDKHTRRATLRVRGYELEEAMCDDDDPGEQYEWSFIDMKFEPCFGTYCVVNKSGVEIDFDVAVECMDDEIREKLHGELAPCSNQVFFTAYEAAHEEKFGEVWGLSKENPVY